MLIEIITIETIETIEKKIQTLTINMIKKNTEIKLIKIMVNLDNQMYQDRYRLKMNKN